MSTYFPRFFDDVCIYSKSISILKAMTIFVSADEAASTKAVNQQRYNKYGSL
jgi:hypothetical protein